MEEHMYITLYLSDASQVCPFLRKKKKTTHMHADKLRTVFWNMMIDIVSYKCILSSGHSAVNPLLAR